MNKMMFFIPLALCSAACSHKGAQEGAASSSGNPLPVSMMTPEPMASRPVSMILKATAFRMSGPYQDHVAITLAPDGSIVYFPDPTDISKNSAPIEIGDGWWLNRQGFGQGSVFTRYTFKEYAALQSVPSVEQLKKAIIPGARVIDFRTLSMPASEAPSKITQVKAELGI